MPGPLTKFPASVDPKNASVFDSTFQAALRKLAEALASGQLQSQVLGSVNGVARTPRFPVAGNTVGGLAVRRFIPNTGSISASMNDYKVIPKIREVPVIPGPNGYRTVDDIRRTHELARQISESGEINPLILGLESGSDYILEGGHRYEALKELGIKSFPALLVRDNEALIEALLKAQKVAR